MLESLVIENYAVVRKAALALRPGMTAVTGETGAGKSISVDALGLVMGARADPKAVRPGAERADVCAAFDLSDSPEAAELLRGRDLLGEDPGLCVIRRAVSRDGRSRAYVNDRNVNTSFLKELAPKLVNIHGQRDGQQILNGARQLRYLDAFAGLEDRTAAVAALYAVYAKARDEVARLGEKQKNMVSEYKLTLYQIAELGRLGPRENEFSELSDEYDRLSNAETLIAGCAAVHREITGDEDGLAARIGAVISRVRALAKLDKKLGEFADGIENARITLEDAAEEINRRGASIEADPERLAFVSARMALYADLGRKYAVKPDELHLTLRELQEKTGEFSSLKDEIEAKTAEALAAKNLFAEKARELGALRRAAAPEFCRKIEEMLRGLSMPRARFEAEFSETAPRASGVDEVAFKFSANAGMAPDLIRNAASGGEISRIALAILVLTANRISAPTLVFDEIDTGISGFAAATAGRLLRRLGRSSQVITVTHLPQVAASAHNHCEVVKEESGGETNTLIRELGEEGRVLEVARLLGGAVVSETAVANARELIAAQAADGDGGAAA